MRKLGDTSISELHERTKIVSVTPPYHSSKPVLGLSATPITDAEDDDATVVTSNTGTNSNGSGTEWATTDSTVTSISSHVNFGSPRSHQATRTITQNYYDVLDEDSIAVDSGASDNFGDTRTQGTSRRDCTTNSIIMASATGDRKTSIATDRFNLPLPSAGLDFHVFEQGDVQRPLLSVGKVCDTGCTIHFDAARCEFHKDGQVLLVAYRDPASGLYLLPRKIPKGTRHALQATGLSAYEERTIPQLVKYLHACAGYPAPQTWIKAIKRGYFMGWPGLDASRVRKYLPKSEIEKLGRLQLVRQGTRSSTSKGEPEELEEEDENLKGEVRMEGTDDERKTSATKGRQRNVITVSAPMEDLKGIIGTDQTGRFPVVSRRGHKYIFIMYDTDTEYIHAVPIESRKSGELIRAFEESYDTLKRCGFEPILHRIDHETSVDLIRAIEAKGLAYEIAPPGNHRTNPAERAIQTFKKHFISILNGVDPKYPPGAWDYLIPQTTMTLNMHRGCRVNPAHSAYSYIHGAFDFSAHPLAPLGCRAIIHERAIGKGGKRGSWGNRGKPGYYIGPAMQSYRVWKFYVPETNSTIESDTAEFFPWNVSIPPVTAATEIAASLDTIQKAIMTPTPTHTEIQESDRLDSVLDRLKKMFQVKEGATEQRVTNAAPTPPVTQPATTGSRARKAKEAEPVALPRVEEGEQNPAPRINQYQRRKKQRYPIGTRIMVPEGKGRNRVEYTGTAKEYNAAEGLYRVVFEDGEYEDFDDNEMEEFLLTKPFRPRKPSTSANQITIPGFYPKAAPTLAQKLFAYNAGSIWDEECKRWMAYRDFLKHPNPEIRKRWDQAGVNEFARLANGHGDIEGLQVITFIARHQMPGDKKATYARYVVDYRPEKSEPWRLRITCGGDKLEYVGDTTTHSASMETIKCQLNNIISRKGSKCACGDISNMYLESLLKEAEYVRFRIELIPTAIVTKYGLRALATPEGYVYARVNKAWYGLKQAGKIAHDDLVDRLKEAGYTKAPLAEGFFRHETRDIDFTLVVDDFLIRYSREEDLEHLRETIGKHYKFKVDMDARQYVGINLKWDYEKRTVRLSMDGYVRQALLEFEHSAPRTPRHAPSRYVPPSYGAKVQYAKVDDTVRVGPKEITFIQKVIGKLLYYARAVDPTMLHALNDIALSASKGTEATLGATTHLLNYAHTHPDSEIIYRASDMVLRVDSDAAYLVAPEARSRAGGYQYLSNESGTLFNGPVLVLAKVIKNVMSSATEAELGALFMNAQEAVGLRNCLEAMGHPQPATPLKTDNSTANGIVNNTMKQKRSKAIDVRFYWLRDRTQQGQFHIFWEPGKNNLADYFTKHHPPAYHKQMRPIQTYIEDLSPESLQGCIRIMNTVFDKSDQNSSVTKDRQDMKREDRCHKFAAVAIRAYRSLNSKRISRVAHIVV